MATADRSRALSRKRPRRRTVALSGADGFIGRNLIGLLEEDPRFDRIVAVDVRRPTTAGPKTRFYQVDLTEPTADARLSELLAAENVDTFVHLAFLSSPTYATAWAHELQSVGTMHVLNACRARGVRKFVLWSETFLYGPHRDNPNFLTESHRLRGIPGSNFLADRIDAERETARFAEENPDRVVTVLRLAPMLGPTVQNYVTRWLSRRLVPTMMGFDPLLQFLHELDAVAAFVLAIDRDAPGVFNIVGDGVLPVSTAVKLAGRIALPVPHFLARQANALLWAAHLNEAPPAFLHFLRYICVADGRRARDELDFRPAFTSREAVLDFGGTLRLRDARLLADDRGGIDRLRAGAS